jgi:archaeosortase A (PGF-CTERM-specific)
VVLLELGAEYHIFIDVILITGLLGLGIGYYLKDKRCHKFRLVGLILFGIFWVLQTPYFFSIGDVFNAIVCILALPFYAYLGYHEYLSYIWDEENKSLKWITGASFFAGGLYFLIDKIPIFSGYLILGVAVQTVGLINLFGFDYGVGSINYAGNPLWYRTNYNEISVQIIGSRASLVQACTAAQSMLIFIAAIYCVQALKKRKWKAFFATVPVIYVLNLIRNVGIIYMMDELKWSYDVAHNTVGKGGSFIALIVLAFIAFKLLPELLDNIWGLIELKDRQKKKEKIEEEMEGEQKKEVEEEIEEEKEGEKTKEVGKEKEGEHREEIKKEEFEEEDPKKEMENEVTVKMEKTKEKEDSENKK